MHALPTSYNTGHMKFAGIYPPLTTPFAADGSVALDSLRANVAKYNASRLAGYVATGSTGEAVMLTRDETEKVWETIREAAAPGKILIAGTGAESTAETIDRTNRAAELGYQAALVKTPHYYKPQMTEEALAAHFFRVADAAKIPILVYSIPQYTGIAIEAPLLCRLAAHPNIIGIKESSGNVHRVAEIIHMSPPGFQTLVGSADTFCASMAVGAVAGILGLACVLPEPCVQLYTAASSGNSDRARDLQHQLLEAATVIVGRLGVPGVKYALDCLGYYGGPARAPLMPLTEAQKREVDDLLAELVPIPSR
jgi:4-hydroxy-2-oxoglutarate aldolase